MKEKTENNGMKERKIKPSIITKQKDTKQKSIFRRGMFHTHISLSLFLVLDNTTRDLYEFSCHVGRIPTKPNIPNENLRESNYRVYNTLQISLSLELDVLFVTLVFLVF